MPPFFTGDKTKAPWSSMMLAKPQLVWPGGWVGRGVERAPEASAPQLPGLDQAWGWCEEGFKQKGMVSRLDAAKSVVRK